ncbi:uncharacterized protein LOC117305622 [Asterias rubens]|uniref:uncharacterized protein LOC117305622 n=1 Tax=Asterias rubens TaxID=7604 RepID=UPI001454FECC|nr:uncharacterized protein LOC117305622 [Asterias rubens]
MLSSSSDFSEVAPVLGTPVTGDVSSAASLSDSDSWASFPLSQMSPPPMKRQKRLLFDTKKILSESPEGKSVTRSIEQSGFLTKKVRHQLVRILVSYLISHHGKNPGAFEKSALAESVIAAFPSLKDPQGITGYEAFYTKGSKGCPAGGYLEEHLRYVRKNMIRKEEVGEHQGRKEEVGKHQVNASAATPDEPDEKQETAEDVLAKVQWLKDNCAPTTKVKEYMSLTSKHRAEWVKDRERTVAEILEEFPRLLGIGMIEQDFQLMYPKVADRLTDKWGGLSDSLIDYATQMFPLWKDVLGLDASTDVKKLTEDEKINLSFFVIPMIFDGCDKKKTGGRFGPKETMKAFIDVQLDIVHMPTYLEKIDATKHPQPFLLVLYSESVLKPSSVFVIIEKNTIPQPSLLKAIDVCYKAHFILDCKYQQLCTSVWKFFERYIFNQPGIPTNKDSPTLRALRAFLAFRNFP